MSAYVEIVFDNRDGRLPVCSLYLDLYLSLSLSSSLLLLQYE